MGRKKQEIPSDLGNADYCYLEITAERKPQIEFVIDKETGELSPVLKKRHNPSLITYPILIDPYGVNVFPANLFMRFLAKQDADLSTLHTHVRALLLFYRWMDLENKTINDCYRDQEQGVVYLFRDFLLNNLKRDVLNDDGELIVHGFYAASTASTYVGTIIRFYTFLHTERIVRFSADFVPFEFYTAKIKKQNRDVNHDMLGHIKRGDTRTIEVQTTGLRKPFGRVQPVSSHHKLSPMREDDKKIFYGELKIDNTNFLLSNDIKDLMLYSATEIGLRVEELVTFPITEIRLPSANETVVKVTISEVLNGCKTKFNKQRTVEVPAEVMNILFQYKVSKARLSAEQHSPVSHNMLFLNPKSGLPFHPATIQRYFSNIRSNIIKRHPDWYFTVHDLRATFATHWLYAQHQQRGLLFDVLLDELKDLMGHNSTITTQKYISYMNTNKYWLEFANRKNTYMATIME